MTSSRIIILICACFAVLIALTVTAAQSPFGQDPPPVSVAKPVPTPVTIPTYEKVEAYGPVSFWDRLNPWRNRRYLNPMLFADAKTAEWVKTTFGAKEIFERVAPGNEGPIYTASHKQRWVRFADGLEMNAGLMATLYIQNAGYDWVPTAPGVIEWYKTGKFSGDGHANGVRAVQNTLASLRR